MKRFISSKKASTRTIAVSLFLVVLIGAGVYFMAFSRPTASSTPISLPGIKTPVWSKSDWEASLLLKENVQTVQGYTVTQQLKPPFYPGSVPFAYSKGVYYYGGGAMGVGLTVYEDFGDFKTYFIYDGITLIGAQTFDKQDRLVAEVSNVTYTYQQNDPTPITIHEIHYGQDGQPIFYCTSKVSAEQKVSEGDVLGAKIRDYYFIWPNYA